MKNLGRATWPLILSFGILSACGDGAGDTPGGFDIGGDSGTDTTGENGEQTVVVELGSGSGQSFQSGTIAATTTDLAAGGSTELSLSVVNAAAGNELLAGQETEVSITSPCLSNDDATTDSPVTTNSGSISVTYTATGCTGQDTVTATATESGATASVVLNIAPASIGDIQSLTPDPSSIALQGSATESRPSSSVVSFVVVDSQNNGIEGLEVSFRLSSGSAGSGADLTDDIAITNSQGRASTTVQAGNQNAIVRVVASVTQNGTTLETTSSPITISTSVPAQAGFSVGSDNFMPNGFNNNGETVNITVRAGDRFGNFANIEGTVINFIASGGAIESDCVLDDQGACSVTWVSQNPRPDDGRIKILARTVGDESFQNNNSSASFDSGVDTFPIPNGEEGEAFLDRNVNGVFDNGVDQPFDFNGNGQFDGPNGQYDGSACLDPDANNCTAGPVQVWGDLQLVMASDNGVTVSLSNVGGTTFCATATASYPAGPGPLPVGTTFDFSVEGGDITSSTSSFTIPNRLNINDFDEECVDAEGDGDPGTDSSLTVTVTPPAPFGGAPAEASIGL